MCLQIVNFTQNKIFLKPIQDSSPRFGPAITELSAVRNKIMNRYTVHI